MWREMRTARVRLLALSLSSRSATDPYRTEPGGTTSSSLPLSSLSLASKQFRGLALPHLFDIIELNDGKDILKAAKAFMVARKGKGRREEDSEDGTKSSLAVTSELNIRYVTLISLSALLTSPS
jgi:hypothetical protein